MCCIVAEFCLKKGGHKKCRDRASSWWQFGDAGQRPSLVERRKMVVLPTEFSKPNFAQIILCVIGTTKMGSGNANTRACCVKGEKKLQLRAQAGAEISYKL